MAKDLNTPDYEDSKVSRINSAGLINSTLERLWLESYNYMAKGNYLLWNVRLDAIWAILGGDIEENGTEDKAMQHINLQISENNLKSFNGSGFDKKPNPSNSITYQYLLKKSLFLRRLQNKQGKGTAYETGDDYDFD